jgi:DNA mismatch repair protein MutL
LSTMESKIKILPQKLVNKIAAGEVVERPASAVKELVENSLDAGARNITIELQAGGTRLIKVTDDGWGMSKDELLLSLERHSTSKISSVDDLSRIATFGFRGEALPAIASVSFFEIRSRDRESLFGHKVAVEGGEIKSTKEEGLPIGTSVEIRELFFNVPARKKFLKTVFTELKHCILLVTRFALTHPEVSFTMTHEDRTIHELRQQEKPEERLLDIYGESLARRMMPIPEPSGESSIPYQIRGHLGNPEVSRNTRNDIHLFVNRRPVSSRRLVHAITSAYGGAIERDRFPIAVVFIEVDSALVDVNVHPTKGEVRFQDENALYDQLHGVCKQALQEKGAVSSVKLEAQEEGEIRKRATQIHFERPVPRGRIDVSPRVPTDRETAEIRREVALRELYKPPEKAAEPNRKPAGEKPESENGAGEFGRPNMWQFAGVYILVQIKDRLLVIDQHAAHERILFEEALESLRRGGQVQQLLFPHTVELTPSEHQAYEQNQELLAKLGFVSEPFGGRTVVVKGLPAQRGNPNPEVYLREVLDDLQERLSAGEEKSRALAAAYACKSAITAGTRLNAEEMNALFDRLFACREPYFCPHGRPTLVEVPVDEFHRKFRRV